MSLFKFKKEKKEKKEKKLITHYLFNIIHNFILFFYI